jgi:polygalacturonase
MKDMSCSFRSVTLLGLLLALASVSYAQRPAEGVFNVRRYGARGDGHTLDTGAGLYSYLPALL